MAREEPSRKKKKSSEKSSEIMSAAESFISSNNDENLFAPDTLVLIGSFLEISDILKSMSGVCKFWNQVSLGDFLWKIIFQREFGTVDWFLEKLNRNLKNSSAHLSFKICAVPSRNRGHVSDYIKTKERPSYKIITHKHPHFCNYDSRFFGYDTDSEDEEQDEQDEYVASKNNKNVKEQTKKHIVEKRSVAEMSTSHDESSPITLVLVQQVLEDCYGENRFWLSLFKLVVSMIPIQNYKMMTEKQIVQPLQKEDDDDEDDEEDDEEEEEDDQEEEDEDEKDDTTSQNTASDLFFKKDYMAKKDEEEDDERMQRLVSQNYCYFTVRFEKMLDDIFAKDSESATTLHNALYLDIKTHKLAVILSIFDRHGMILNYFGSNSSTTQKYLNKITYELAIHAQNIRKYVMTQRKKPALPRTPYISECDQMCVGLKDSHHSISILKFCYSILCDKEDTIYQPTKENSSATVTQKLDSDDDVKIPPEKNIAVGPLTEDAFMPFVKYRLMDQPEFDNYAYGVTRVVASMEGQWQRAHFASSKPGWCCGFWNANFYWYRVARFQTAIDFSATRIILRVEQNQSDILHNLC